MRVTGAGMVGVFFLVLPNRYFFGVFFWCFFWCVFFLRVFLCFLVRFLGVLCVIYVAFSISCDIFVDI